VENKNGQTGEPDTPYYWYCIIAQTYVGLGSRELELNETDLGVLHPGRATGSVHGLLGEYEAFHKLRIIDGAAQLLHDLRSHSSYPLSTLTASHLGRHRYLDVIEVDVGGGLRVDDLEDSVHGDGRQQVGVLRHDLGSTNNIKSLDERASDRRASEKLYL
jgi:hypothetical protein